MEELKPCPFCGGEAEIVGGPENWTPTFYDPDSGGDPIAVVCKTCACGLHFFDGYAEAASAWNNRPDGWISIDDRLPENNTEVLISIDYGNGKQSVLMGYMRSQDVSWRGVVGQKLIGVTHWRPLPEPPKGE